LEQRSFKMSPQQYMDKLEGVAALVNALGQTDKVRAASGQPVLGPLPALVHGCVAQDWLWQLTAAAVLISHPHR